MGYPLNKEINIPTLPIKIPDKNMLILETFGLK